VIDRSAASAELTIEVAGVGYRVTTTAATLSRLPVDEAVLLWIHHHFVKEGDQRLFGFADKVERSAFEGLLAAHKVGPALALAILATHPVPHLARILADEDVAALCEVPGVGRKTAERLLIELRSSLVLPVLDDGGSSGAVIDLAGAGGRNGNGAGGLADVREALDGLGYSSEEIRRAVAALGDEVDRTEDSSTLLRLALLALADG
jgi:Holliday junction DNA helicase RuvA